MYVLDVIKWKFESDKKILLASQLYEIYMDAQVKETISLAVNADQPVKALELIFFESHPSLR